ncbi:MAG: nucleoside triphosphate pyrophosphatase [Acidimicrobiia bacterium]
MAAPRLVLASASPARLRLLRQAGLDPEVVVSGLDEDAVVAELGPASARVVVEELAARKAGAVAEGLDDGLVVGCDSMLELGGEAFGRPASVAAAERLWHRLRGAEATLLTGHAVVDAATGGLARDVEATVVRFGRPSDAEIAAYVASGEPVSVAGAFTLDGRSAPFVDGVDGNPGNVVGLSLPLLRRLLAALGVPITALWT